MAGKIPKNAVDIYIAMGPSRSYEALAKKLGVAKRSITKKASKEKWQERVAEVEKKARESSLQKTAETLGSINDRHLRLVRAVQGKAIAALKDMPLKSGMDAIRALDITIRQERMLMGINEGTSMIDEEQEKCQASELAAAKDELYGQLIGWPQTVISLAKTPEMLREYRGFLDEFKREYKKSHPDITEEEYLQRDLFSEFGRWLYHAKKPMNKDWG